MNIHSIRNLLVGLFATAMLLTSSWALAEATLPEVYRAVESGQMAKANAMIKEVLQNHPNSAKANYVAAEIYLKEGKLELARSYFLKAENLAPGLPFAQPAAVQKLQVALAGGVTKTTAASAGADAGAGSLLTSPVFWILIAVLGGGIFLFLRKRNRAAPVQVYNAPSAGYPRGPVGPNGFPAGPNGHPGGPAGYPGAAPGMGGGLMGSLATGAALGVGMYAGQALASNLMGGHEGSHPANSNPDMNQVSGPAPMNPNFGVRDGSSWDDSGSSSWDDGGGDFMSDV